MAILEQMCKFGVGWFYWLAKDMEMSEIGDTELKLEKEEETENEPDLP